METTPSYWRKCSSCKKPIHFMQKFWVCNVSTCNRKRTGMVFCQVSCWDAHVPVMNHRESWAEERIAPTKEVYLAAHTTRSNSSPPSQIKKEAAAGRDPQAAPSQEILIVASKLKDYLRDIHGLNTAQSVLHALSNQVRQECQAAIKRAEQAGRKTVMDRDFI